MKTVARTTIVVGIIAFGGLVWIFYTAFLML